MGNYAGLVITGVAGENERAGYSVSGIGDINGDGIDDIAIAAPRADFYDAASESTQFSRGAVYVVFGQGDNTFPPEINLEDLDGTDGFKITPQADLTDDLYGGGPIFGVDVKGLGDVNGDGVDDFGIAQSRSDTSGYYYEGGGSTNGIEGLVYVVYGGQEPFEATEDINGLGGFRIDTAGYVQDIVALGDVNGDGINDVGVNAVNRDTGQTGYLPSYYIYDVNGNGVYDSDVEGERQEQSGSEFVIGETKAFVIYGTDEERVSQDPIANPVNDGNDGGGFYGDFPVAVTANPAGETIGETIVNTEMLDGSDGFTIITGRTATASYFGYYGEFGRGLYGQSDVYGGLQTMGDFNGDGIADMMVEQIDYFADPLIRINTPDGAYSRDGGYLGGSTRGNFIIFGKDGGPSVNEIDINAFPTVDSVDFQVLSFATFNDSRDALGDVSGNDGFGEIGFSSFASGDSSPIDGFDGTVGGVVVYNGTDETPLFSDPTFNSTDPKARSLVIQDVIDGQGAFYYDATSNFSDTFTGLFGAGVRGVGDVNGDGRADFIIGGNTFGGIDSSDSEAILFLIFGSDDEVTGAIELNELVASGGAYRISAGPDSADVGSDAAAAGDLNGDGFDDIVIGDAYADGASFSDGEAVVIFGHGLEAADAADGTNDNRIVLSNLNVNVETGARPTEIRFDEAGFFIKSVTEGDTSARTISFDIIRDGDLTDAVTVDYAVSGDGFAPANAADFVGGALPSGTVTFDIGSDTATLEIQIAGDVTVESTERFEVNLSNPTTDSGNEAFISGGTAFGQIVDNDTPAQVWVSFSSSASEDTDPVDDFGGVRFVIRRTGDLDGEVTVDFSVDEGNSLSSFNAGPEDFLGYMLPDGTIVEFGQTSSFPLTGQMTIPDGSSFEELRILPQPDLDIENSERFTFQITDLATTGDKGVEILGNRDTAFGTIINDDFSPGIFVGADSVLEGTNLPAGAEREIVYTFEKQGTIEDAVEISYRLTGVETIPTSRIFGADEDDFVDVDLSGDIQTITIPAGLRNSIELRLPVNPDVTIEPTEQIQLEIVGVEGRAGVDYNVNRTVLQASIFNDDGRPAIPTIPFDVDGDGEIEDGEEIPVEADVFGDPHITTLDGLGYDFQAVGEYVLVETLDGATNDFAVHVRFEPFPGSDVVSVTTRMSVEVAGAVVEIDALGDDPILIDGVAPTATDLAIGGIDIDGDGQFDVEINGGEFTVYLNVLDDGSAEQLKVGIFDGSLNVCVFLGDPDQGGNAGAVQGLMGNANGDLADDYALRDGGTIPAESISTDADGTPQLTFDYLYGAYADSWAINGNERVFTDDAPDFPENFPAAAFTLDDLPTAVVEAATQAALDAGLDPSDNEVIFENAVLDFALTGSDAFFDSAQALVAEPEAASNPTDTPEVPATVGVTAVTSEITEGDTGNQSVTFTFYRIGDVEGALDVDYAIGGDVDAGDLATGTALTGTVSFADSEDTRSITVDISGDLINEADEDLKVMITGTSEAGTLIGASQGITTILTDDFAPVAVDDTFSTNEDTSVSGDLFLPNPAGGDADGDGDAFTVVSVNGVAGAANGNQITLASGAFLFVNADGTFEYDPAGGAAADDTEFDRLSEGALGMDSFTYAISDGNGGESEATVTINVTGINDAPEAFDDTFDVDEGDSVSGNVFDGDSDPEDDDLTVLSINGESVPADGAEITTAGGASVTILANGNISYNTNGAFEQLGAGDQDSETLEIVVADAGGLTDNSEVTFTINGVNDGPVGGDDTSATLENAAVEISIAELLANDSDVDSDTLSITGVGEPGNGSATLNAETITYRPEPDFVGEDSFTYTLSDGDGGETEVTVTVAVTDVPNTPPVADDDDASTNEDTAVEIFVLENDEDADGDPVDITATSDPTNGDIDIENGVITYTPDANFNGGDSFTYTISDGKGGSDDATVTVNVTAVNDAPDAADDFASTDEDTPLAGINVLENDTDEDGDDTLAVTAFDDSGTTGVVTLNDDGTFDYDPNGAFEGLDDGDTATDSFSYTVSDGTETRTATVEITINGVTDLAEPPVIEGADFAAPEILRGTAEAEVFISNGGAFDRMIGGGGADCFVFGDETSNGVFERDFIMDFELGVDKLDFGGAEIDILASSRFTVIRMGTDGDQLTLIGSGLTEDAILGSIVDDTIA